MASILKVDTLTGVATAGSIAVTGEGNSTTTNLQQGLAKQWVDFSMAGTTARDSLNLSSLTDSATGKFHASASSAFNNVNYAVQYSGNVYAGDSFYGDGRVIAKISFDTTTTTTKYDIISYNSGNSTYYDGTYNYLSAHGDLA